MPLLNLLTQRIQLFSFEFTTSSALTIFDVRAHASIIRGWDGVKPVIAILNINHNIVAPSTASPAFRDGASPLPSGSLIILNIGSGVLIYGRGGAGGAGGGPGISAGGTGSGGGTALYTRTPLKITNGGTVGGGQGGQGGQGGFYTDHLAGKSCVFDGQSAGAAGATGADGLGTTGGGGASGSYGTCQFGSGGTSGGAGGAAGNCADGDSYITWNTAGTRNGPRIN